MEPAACKQVLTLVRAKLSDCKGGCMPSEAVSRRKLSLTVRMGLWFSELRDALWILVLFIYCIIWIF